MRPASNACELTHPICVCLPFEIRVLLFSFPLSEPLCAIAARPSDVWQILNSANTCGTHYCLPSFIAQCGLRLVSTMAELNDAIARLELRSEQLILHLRSIQRTAPGAREVRSPLVAKVVRVVALKAQRQQHVELLELNQAV